MIRTLERAISAVSSLSEADQELIGHQLLTHVARIQQLRAEVDQGVRSLDAGLGREPDIDAFLKSKRRGPDERSDIRG
jgi:hypothetical protein